MRKTLIRPTDAENAAINAAARGDADNLPLTGDELLQFKRGRGRPAGSNKEQVTLRLDAEVLETFKATGTGWQTRINEVLKGWAKHH